MQAEQFHAHAQVEDAHWWFVARRRVLLALLARIRSMFLRVADVSMLPAAGAGS